MRLKFTIPTLCLLVLISNTSFADQALTLHVINRLTFGPSPDLLRQVESIGIDRYIEQQLHPEKIPLPDTLNTKLQQITAIEPSTQDILQELRDQRKAKADASAQNLAKRHPLQRLATDSAHAARLLSAIESPRQLEEVLVDFWFNHFNVYEQKGLDRVFVTRYEREAIRPYVLRNFRDLLGATAHHPAMLFYLDNWQSVAPGFQSLRRKAPAKVNGLNENYARELMELHTLGVDGGYTQADVTQLARIFTGWTISVAGRRNPVGTFLYDAARHDNGSKIWMGQTITNQGEQEGEKALDDLAANPATAQHIAYQLAQYFVADDPPASLVQQLSNTFRNSHGDLRAVMTTLFASKEFRDPQYFNKKFKTPYQYVISSIRATGLPVSNTRPISAALKQMGQPLYGCLTPDGYKNTTMAWLNPDALNARIQFAGTLASGKLPLDLPLLQSLKADKPDGAMQPFMRDPVDPQPLLNTLGGNIRPETLNKIANNPIALRSTLILGSPDFMYH